MSISRLSFSTRVGSFTVTEEDGVIVRIAFGAKSGAQDETKTLKEARRQLRAYAEGKRISFTFPYRWTGTPFQDAVWKALEQIPFGKLLSYGAIAEQIGKPGGARAVGNAAGHNPLPIVVPCHRVIASGKRLGGFGPGPTWKKKLLSLEGTLSGLRS